MIYPFKNSLLLHLGVPQKQSREISAPGLCPLLPFPPNCRARAARSDEPLEVVVAGLRVGDVLVFVTEASF